MRGGCSESALSVVLITGLLLGSTCERKRRQFVALVTDKQLNN